MKHKYIFSFFLFALISQLSFAQPSNYGWIAEFDGAYSNTRVFTPNTPALNINSLLVQATSSGNQFVIEWNSYADKWQNTSFDIDSEMILYHGDGNSPNSIINGGVTMGKYYTIQIEGLAYSNRNAVIMETDNMPVTIASLSREHNTIYHSQDAIINVALSSAKSPQEKAYIRYTKDNWTTSEVSEVLFNDDNTTGYGKIPADFNQNNGTYVQYYVYTTTVSAINTSNHDLITLNLFTGSDYTIQSAWASTESGNWTTTNNIIWGGSAVPASSETQPLILNHDITIDDAIENQTVIINPGKTLTINAGKSLKVTTNLIVDGSLILNSSSDSYSSILPVSISVSGTGSVAYNRYTNVVGTLAGGGNDLVSPPVSGQNWSAFLTANGTVLANNGSGTYAFAPFDKTTGTFDNYTATESPDPVLTSSVGYRAGTTSGGTLTFKGSVLTTDYSGVTISESGPEYAKWNLIGNPYPSYLKADDFLSAVNNVAILDPLATFIYGYNGSPTGSQYDMIGSADGHLVAPGQGFFVASNATGGAVQFNASMRSTTGGNDFIANRISATENEILLEVSKSDNAFTTTINFNSNSSQGINPGYDGAIFGDNAPEFAIYSQLVQDNTGRDLAIQSLGITDMDDVAVPLGINANQGEQLAISIANSNLPANINVYLEDNATNTWTLLNDGDYVFTPTDALSGTGRFFLRFSSTTLSVDDNSLNGLQIFAPQLSNTIIIKGALQDNSIATLYDMHGRAVMQQLLDSSSTTNSMDISSYSTGVYIVQLNNRSQQKTQKVIVK